MFKLFLFGLLSFIISSNLVYASVIGVSPASQEICLGQNETQKVIFVISASSTLDLTVSANSSLVWFAEDYGLIGDVIDRFVLPQENKSRLSHSYINVKQGAVQFPVYIKAPDSEGVYDIELLFCKTPAEYDVQAFGCLKTGLRILVDEKCMGSNTSVIFAIFLVIAGLLGARIFQR